MKRHKADIAAGPNAPRHVWRSFDVRFKEKYAYGVGWNGLTRRHALPPFNSRDLNQIANFIVLIIWYRSLFECNKGCNPKLGWWSGPHPPVALVTKDTWPAQAAKARLQVPAVWWSPLLLTQLLLLNKHPQLNFSSSIITSCKRKIPFSIGWKDCDVNFTLLSKAAIDLGLFNLLYCNTWCCIFYITHIWISVLLLKTTAAKWTSFNCFREGILHHRVIWGEVWPWPGHPDAQRQVWQGEARQVCHPQLWPPWLLQGRPTAAGRTLFRPSGVRDDCVWPRTGAHRALSPWLQFLPAGQLRVCPRLVLLYIRVCWLLRAISWNNIAISLQLLHFYVKIA